MASKATSAPKSSRSTRKHRHRHHRHHAKNHDHEHTHEHSKNQDHDHDHDHNHDHAHNHSKNQDHAHNHSKNQDHAHNHDHPHTHSRTQAHDHSHQHHGTMHRSIPEHITTNEVVLYADAICKKTDGGDIRCGYGILCESPRLRIAEPLPGSPQSSSRAQLTALSSALELAHGVRARHVTICLNSSTLVHYKNYMLPKWVSQGFRYNRTKIQHAALWTKIFELNNALSNRGVAVYVVYTKRRSSAKMVAAQTLANMGSESHEQCELCGNLHGREFRTHDCKPVCQYDNCDGRSFDNIDEYNAHVDCWHRRECPSMQCRDSGVEMFSDKELRHHLKKVHRKEAACDFCERMFSCVADAKKHIRRCPMADPCRDCGRQFSSRRLANIHREKEEGRDVDEFSDYGSDEDSLSNSSYSEEDDLQTFSSKYR